MISSTLLLGVAFINDAEISRTYSGKPKRGQEYRDMCRCKGLESLGYSVSTIDNKHDEDRAVRGKHCKASFCDPRRMKLSMTIVFGNRKWRYIILDYFFSPVSIFLLSVKFSLVLI